MSEVLHANIFFFITSIAVIACTLLICVALVYIIRLMRSAARIVERIEHGTEAIHADVQKVRQHMAEGGVLKKIAHFLFGAKSEHTEHEDTEDAETSHRTRTSRRRSPFTINDES